MPIVMMDNVIVKINLLVQHVSTRHVQMNALATEFVTKELVFVIMDILMQIVPDNFVLMIVLDTVDVLVLLIINASVIIVGAGKTVLKKYALLHVE